MAAEEAAKILILLDLVRLGWQDWATGQLQVAKFYQHLARGIYAVVTASSPGSLGEVREMVERHRPSHYLDGPNDADWIFRNRIESDREEVFYVDLVKDEESLRWLRPAIGPSPWTTLAVTELASAMGRVGLLSARGLELTNEAWKDAELSDNTPWPYIHERSGFILGTLRAEGLLGMDVASENDVALILDRWTFPLHGFDMKRLDVSQKELLAEREWKLARIEREWYDGGEY